MLLRFADPADLSALLDVQERGAVRSLGHIFPQETHPFPRDELSTRWLQEIASADITVYVAEDDDRRLVAFAATRADEFLHFGTAVDTWGTGLASEVHDEVLNRMSAAGVSRARLHVFEENRRARRFYEKHGWRATGQRRPTTYPPYPELLEYTR
jgi:RimJ/RimL family protein N-acetyltransferase